VIHTNREVAVGCAEKLGVWEAETGALIQDYSMIITSPGNKCILLIVTARACDFFIATLQMLSWLHMFPACASHQMEPT